MAKKKVLKKPRQHVKYYFDYSECSHYLETKYGYDERDYAGRFKNRHDSERPYLDFWHWVLDHHEVHRGGFITFHKLELDNIGEDWVKEIFTHYIEEFADENGNLEMRTNW